MSEKFDKKKLGLPWSHGGQHEPGDDNGQWFWIPANYYGAKLDLQEMANNYHQLVEALEERCNNCRDVSRGESCWHCLTYKALKAARGGDNE